MNEIRPFSGSQPDTLSTLTPGQGVPNFQLQNHQGQWVELSKFKGRPVVLCFYANDAVSTARDLLLALRDHQPVLDQVQAQVISISTDLPHLRQSFAQHHQLAFELLSDQSAAVCHRYGVSSVMMHEGNPVNTIVPTVLLLDEQGRLIQQYRALKAQDPDFKQLLKDITQRRLDQPFQHISAQAPVLLVPHVITEMTALSLYQWWVDALNASPSSEPGADPKHRLAALERLLGQPQADDHTPAMDTTGQSLEQSLDSAVEQHILPWMQKAYFTRLKRQEPYRVVFYDTQTAGSFQPGGLLTTQSSRQWAVCIPLTEGFEGGEWSFPDFGSSVLYKPSVGSALVFSMALAHEIKAVLSGERLVLMGYFAGERI